jgi:hypothetical protein
MKRIDHEIKEALYDPKKLTWKQFIAAHKNCSTLESVQSRKSIRSKEAERIWNPTFLV